MTEEAKTREPTEATIHGGALLTWLKEERREAKARADSCGEDEPNFNLRSVAEFDRVIDVVRAMCRADAAPSSAPPEGEALRTRISKAIDRFQGKLHSEKIGLILEALATPADPQQAELAYRARELAKDVCPPFGAVIDGPDGWPVCHCRGIEDARELAARLSLAEPPSPLPADKLAEIGEARRRASAVAHGATITSVYAFAGSQLAGWAAFRDDLRALLALADRRGE